ncbi:MAG: phytanoyl-CoA dioxygenase family protein [Hyphomicrobiales bacterium]|nr:phytanoyl-CoA dioxygenase family protein [Hyphomicrobiales bacterium]
MEAVQPPLDEFKGHPGAEGMATQLKDINKSLPLRVLSDEDWKHWTTKGYVIVRQAVPMGNVERTIDILWEFEEKDPSDPSTWYTPQRRAHGREELNNAGMVEIYNHQYLWDNRQEPRLYNAYVDIWDREDLWVGIDRANLLPPKKTPGNPDGFIHWDVNTCLRPLPVGVQGVLSLVRQDREIGGFQCIPELFANLQQWAKTQPADRNPMLPDITGFTIERVEMDPGDLLIFNSLLAHGVRPNHSKDRVRMAQYIAMYPAREDDEEERLERIRLWRERDHPRGGWPGDPREWEKHHCETARLTLLGEKLLGLRRWRDQ